MPVADFLTIMTLLYLFHYQGMQLIKHRKQLLSPKRNRHNRPLREEKLLEKEAV